MGISDLAAKFQACRRFFRASKVSEQKNSPPRPVTIRPTAPLLLKENGKRTKSKLLERSRIFHRIAPGNQYRTRRNLRRYMQVLKPACLCAHA